MAKKTETEDVVSIEKLTERVQKDTDKDYGVGVMVDGADVISNPPKVIPLSPVLDIITSGGIEEGSWVGVTGNPKTTKTSLCLEFAATCQQPEYGSRPIYYLKAEGRLSVSHLKNIKRLDLTPGKFNVIQSTERKILSAQDYLRIGGNIIKSVPGAVLIIDSASALCDENELNSDIGDQAIASGNKLFSKFVRTNAQAVPVNRCVVMVITHLISNIGKPGFSERVARATQYQYDYMLRTISKAPWKVGEKQIGFEVKWACNASKLGPPGMTMESFLRFGVGIDHLYEAVKLGMEVGLITGKPYYTLSFLNKPAYQDLFEGEDPPRFHGNEKLYQGLIANPEWVKALQTELSGLAGGLALAGSEE